MEQLMSLLSQPMVLYVSGALALLVVGYFSIRSYQLKQAAKRLGLLETRYNSVKSVPLLFKLNKSLALARLNAQINESVVVAKNDFNTVQESIKSLALAISDTDDLIALGKLKSLNDSFVSIEDLLMSCETKVDALNKALDDILAQEEKLRLQATDLKAKFREVKQVVAANVSRLAFGMDMIDRLLSDTEKKFSTFEEWMYASEFAKANALLAELQNDISQSLTIVDYLPEALSQLRGVLPRKIDVLQGVYDRLIRSGCILEELGVESQLRDLHSDIKHDLDQLRQGSITLVVEHIEQYHELLEALTQQLSYEESCFEESGKLLKQIHQALVSGKTKYLEINRLYEKVSSRYGFEDLTVTLTATYKSITIFTKMASNLVEEINQKQRLASDIVVRIRDLYHSIEQFNSELQLIANRLTAACEDEDRARKQNLKLHLIVNEILVKVRKNHLPSIAETFDRDLASANSLVSEIDELLAADLVDIPLLNSKLTEAIDKIYKFYNNVNNIVGTAMMVENAIVFGNLYRSSYPEIDAELTRAELSYRNGEYTNGLTIALPVLEKLFPSNYTELIKEHSKTL